MADKNNAPARLDKILASIGISRADAKKAIASGRVAVNGVTERDSGRKVLPGEVSLDGQPIQAELEVYLMIHKPAGVVTATEDKRFQTVVDLLPEV